jgi:hypothetical protein
MNETMEIRYSRAYAYFALIVMIALISFLTYLVLSSGTEKWKGNSLIFLSMFGLLLFLLTIYLIVRYLIPAVKRQNAIILNNDFIIDNIRNNKISWNNVREIRSINGRANFIAIDLINNSEVTCQTKNIFKKILYANNKIFYGTPILIPTQFVDGSSIEIMNIFFSFFQQTRTACNIGSYVKRCERFDIYLNGTT